MGRLLWLPRIVLPLVAALIAVSRAQNASFSDEDAAAYLARFEYESPPPEGAVQGMETPEAALRRSVRDFQRVAGLEETGELNADTRAWMQKPRCGCPDGNLVTGASSGGRRRRYATWNYSWSSNTVTYRIQNYTPDFAQAQQEVEILEVFNMWAQFTPLVFERKYDDYTGSVDIEIKFVAGDHGDGSPFDGPSGVLAHAFLPYGGDAHMDEDENWTSGTYSGINFFQVFLHEIGHSLGLLHSAEQGAIMYPYYMGYVPGFQLHQDDIDGVRSMYGWQATAPPPTEEVTTSGTNTTTDTGTGMPPTEVPDDHPSGAAPFSAVSFFHIPLWMMVPLWSHSLV